MTSAWHFRAAEKLLSDGTEAKAVDIHRGPLVLCSSGLHASRRLIDALVYAPGSWLARVECSGEIIEGIDKLVCSSRRVVWIRDVSTELRDFARWCARSVLHLWTDPVPASVSSWLESGDATAWSAASSAAWSAARSAAWSATSDAASDAADRAAYRAARSAQNARLEATVNGQ